MHRTFICSLLIHAAVVVCLIWPKANPARKRTPPIEIEVKERPIPTPISTPASKGSKASKHRTLPWNRLNVHGDFGLAAHAAATQGPPDQDDISGWTPDQWGSGGGGAQRLEQIKHTLHFDKLASEIEGMLNYPGVLARHGFQDTINARLVFGKGSHCDWRKSTVHLGQRYLTVYVLALLKKLCSLETIEHIGLPEGQVVDLSFRFSIESPLTPDKTIPTSTPPQLTGNVLMFTRISQRLPLEYHIGPLTGSFLLPLIALDWGWVIEHWDSWVEDKDPLREFNVSY